MKLEIHIKSNDAAIADDPIGEVGRILREAAYVAERQLGNASLFNDDEPYIHPLRDSNGVRVGHMAIVIDHD